eukprot:611803_1
MALQVGCVSNGLCDIRLLSKEEDKRHYMCGQCHNLAINTKALICTNHEQDTTLYCGSCAIAIQSANQCPINQHQNPIFSDQHVAQARIKQNVEFICPYSAQFNRYHAPHHAPHHGAIQDTLEGKNQQDEDNRCRWKGTYTQLQHHVMECRFKPRDTKAFIDLKGKVHTLESGLNNKISALEHTMHESRQSIDVLTNELSNKVTRDEMKEHVNVNANSSLIWIVCAVVAVVFAVLAVNLYKNNSDYTALKVEWMAKIDEMRTLITAMDDELDGPFHNITLQINTLNTTVRELRQSVDVLTNELSNKVDHHQMKEHMPPQSPHVLTNELSNEVNHDEIKEHISQAVLVQTLVGVVLVVMFAILCKHSTISTLHMYTQLVFLYNYCRDNIGMRHVKMKLKEHSHRKYKNDRSPGNLLQDNDNCYWSADNKEFKANENDWIIFKLKQENTLYLPTKCMV